MKRWAAVFSSLAIMTFLFLGPHISLAQQEDLYFRLYTLKNNIRKQEILIVKLKKRYRRILLKKLKIQEFIHSKQEVFNQYMQMRSEEIERCLNLAENSQAYQK
ncbi:hypothetical protein EPO66_05955 [bacterium]|nr:MAG: hypothetical protein EPO66_05955 [bacterium]